MRIQNYIHVSTGFNEYPMCFNTFTSHDAVLAGTSLMIVQLTHPNKFKSLVVEIRYLFHIGTTSCVLLNKVLMLSKNNKILSKS